MWPNAPTCHNATAIWRPQHLETRPDYGFAFPFRTCSYCGSIHPEDLLKAVQDGARLRGADWKYGYPHKHYVAGILNPNRGATVWQYTYCSDRDRLVEMALAGHEPEATDHEGWRVVTSTYPAPTETPAKWYNVHLVDLSDQAFAMIATTLLQCTTIAWSRRDGKTHWLAPCAGYQR